MSTQSGLLTLKQARELRGLSQYGLARCAGVSQPTVSKIENGYLNCATSHDVAHALSDALDIRITDINWPFGLTHRGRPMGAMTEVRHPDEEAAKTPKCASCFTILPRSGHCDFCD